VRLLLLVKVEIDALPLLHILHKHALEVVTIGQVQHAKAVLLVVEERTLVHASLRLERASAMPNAFLPFS
jgi:hypothetical protein